jgi:hypothetical protein
VRCAPRQATRVSMIHPFPHCHCAPCQRATHMSAHTAIHTTNLAAAAAETCTSPRSSNHSVCCLRYADYHPSACIPLPASYATHRLRTRQLLRGLAYTTTAVFKLLVAQRHMNHGARRECAAQKLPCSARGMEKGTYARAVRVSRAEALTWRSADLRASPLHISIIGWEL